VINIAIDAMGGDYGPSVTIPAALAVLAKYPSLRLILVGDEPTLSQMLKKNIKNHSSEKQRLTIHHASQQVEMGELPSQALRTKKDSSMRVAINLVKEGVAEACVSAGNTGALMATARFVLKTLPGIDRPAIISTFPSMNPDRNVRMLDLGANVDSTAENLFQFAVMGSVLASAVDNIERPRVSLLNIGAEEIKGNEQVKQTAQLLTNSKTINYIGYIEGGDIHEGNTDVVVCDGIFISTLMKEAFMQNIFTKVVGMITKPILKKFIKRIDPSRYNGATFIGLQGTVIKSHGSANAQAYARAIEEAIINVEKKVPELIRHKVEEVLKSSLPPQSE
jgi:glycerol-3-phosphate acyltransferase PlsX